MKVGLDTFTIRELNLDPFHELDFVKEHKLAGVQFGGLSSLSDTLDDLGKLREVRAHADGLNLYSHVSVSSPNPHRMAGSPDEHLEGIKQEIEAAAKCGWHELHGSLGGPDERYRHPVSWDQQLADSTDFVRKLGPVLRQQGSRINLETHGDTTTFELVRMVEEVGPDILGICLDTANVLCLLEDPVSAARRAAPYTHLTHTKDAIIYFTDTGYRRQVRPPGQGALDWKRILPILAEYSPDLALSIEDHQWLYDVAVFEPNWLAFHPDLTREELASVVRIAWDCQQRINSGQCSDPEAYEAIPYQEQVLERIAAGRDYLNALLGRLGLAS